VVLSSIEFPRLGLVPASLKAGGVDPAAAGAGPLAEPRGSTVPRAQHADYCLGRGATTSQNPRAADSCLPPKQRSILHSRVPRRSADRDEPDKSRRRRRRNGTPGPRLRSLTSVSRNAAFRLAAVALYLALCAGGIYSASEDPAAEGTWVVILGMLTLLIGAVIGCWSVMLGAVMIAALVLGSVFGPCDPTVAYSCDASVDPWWPVVLIDTVVLSVLLTLGAGLGQLAKTSGRADTATKRRHRQ